MDVSSNASVALGSVYFICFTSQPAIFIFTSYIIANILFLVPVFVLILCVGVQQRRRRRSRSAAAAMSHSDFFTYNMIGMELMGIAGSSLFGFGAYAKDLTAQVLAVSMFAISSPGQTLFHLLTCGERYLAVVHPITYLALKRAGGVRIRNVGAGCVWLLCVGLDGISKLLNGTFTPITHASIMVFSFLLLFAFSCSVLRVLTHAGPRRRLGGNAQQVDLVKLRAFHTIAAITVATLLRFVGVLVYNVMFTSAELSQAKCAAGASATWLTLLFLQRAGRLPGPERSTESG